MRIVRNSEGITFPYHEMLEDQLRAGVLVEVTPEPEAEEKPQAASRKPAAKPKPVADVPPPSDSIAPPPPPAPAPVEALVLGDDAAQA